MNDQQKAEIYDRLLSEHNHLSNQVNAIKSENIDLTQQQEQQIRKIQIRQSQIEQEMRRLF